MVYWAIISVFLALTVLPHLVATLLTVLYMRFVVIPSLQQQNADSSSKPKAPRPSTTSLESIVRPRQCFLFDLPDELLEHITRFLHDEAINHPSSSSFNPARQGFVSLSTTCRRLNAIVTPQLYHTVGDYDPLRFVLHLCKYPYLGRRVRVCVIQYWKINYQDLVHLHDDLELHLSSKFRKFRITDWEGATVAIDLLDLIHGGFKEDEFKSALSAVMVTLCPDTEIIRISDFRWAIPRGMYTTKLNKLSKLVSSEGSITFPPDQTTLHCQLDWAFNLTSINMSCSNFELETFIQIMDRCKSLKSCTYGVAISMPPPGRDVYPAEFAHHLGKQRKTLKALRLLWPEHDVPRCLCFPKDQGIQTLAHLDVLEELHIGLPGLAIYNERSGTTSTFFKKFFPKGIRKLLLWDGSQVWNLEPLVKIASQHFPDLREVHICRSRWTIKPREKILIQLFAKQGIRLTYSGDDDRDMAGAMDPPGTRGLMNLCSLLSTALRADGVTS